MMEQITQELLEIISDVEKQFGGAYSIRENGQCTARKSSAHVQIESQEGRPGLTVRISSQAQDETVFIPACVTHGDIDDLVYNDFYVAPGANVTIVAGCGVHTDGEDDARHNGIHRFFLGRDAHVLYKEKHVGTGKGRGLKKIDPVTDAELEEGAVLEMDTIQIGGVDRSTRTTRAKLAARARLTIHESILTENDQTATTEFEVTMDGDDSAVDLISRSVARGNSYQSYHSKISGNCRCSGHSECDAILADNGRVNASPELYAGNIDAALIHEAAIGKIAGEQIIKLRTLGLTEEEAEARIIEGFLKG